MKQFLPVTKEEMLERGWSQPDFVYVNGDAYVDHPSFGAAIITRVLEAHGFKVCMLAQPNWKSVDDFKRFGKPRLGFLVSSGNIDSMVNHYTVSKRHRKQDLYSNNGESGHRPDRAVIVYCQKIREAYKDATIIIGGIEASLRRFAHYDYWDNSIHPSILVDSGADWLCYGMGERTMLELTRAIESGRNLRQMENIAQLAFYRKGTCKLDGALVLHSYERCLEEPRSFAENFHQIEIHANMLTPQTLVEPVGDGYVRVNPPLPPATTEEMDSFWDLPFTKKPHPRYKGKRIPAYDMIKDSIITHRGCFGGCNFCTIAAHQGKFIQSRSEESILKEVRELAAMPEFRGNISDLGAPTANMYGMHGKDPSRCAVCRRKSCLFPSPCSNMDRNHERVLALYRRVDAVKGIRHSYIGSGVRYDLFLDEKGFVDGSGKKYLRELMLHHTSGRLKVAPEHTEDKVLYYMAKPSFRLFERLRAEFDKINREEGTHTELVPYFISSHPGCTLQDMRKLASNKSLKGIWMEQVQDFMPTPMTTSSIMFCTGLDPRTMKEVFVEHDPERKKEQKSLFFRK